MNLAVDVQYYNDSAVVAGILFESWSSTVPLQEVVSASQDILPYEPGNFYKRELPCILKLLDEHELTIETIVVDGYVYLDGTNKPGLGKRLYDALGQTTGVIGVAKKVFAGIGNEHAIIRGCSSKPLFITSTMDLDLAKNSIINMHGQHRIPTLLKRADQLCRQEAKKQLRFDR
tara:strand:+ start:682 stop:1203 length:522 start_codon:yes stop_codon:yes gene_type:complete